MNQILDNFLLSYKMLASHAKTATFKDEVNPVDKVVYPNICRDIPEEVKSELAEKIYNLYGLSVKHIFMRRSPKGTVAPNIAHTDNSMGRLSVMVYMNNNGESGTAFLRHLETGATYAPTSKHYTKKLSGDSNNTKAWTAIESVEMRKNRALFFDSSQFHCAYPLDGFGYGNKSRTVLTAFCD